MSRSKQLNGALWEDYLRIELPNTYEDYDIEDVKKLQDDGVILKPGQYRDSDGNKYPDFRCTHIENKLERVYIDAKRKNGGYFKGRHYVTADKTFLDAYGNVVQKDINEGINATGILLFWHEVGGHAYLAPLEPHEWVDFKNNYGPDLSGCYWIDQLTPAPEFDGFADII
ncbi:MAG: hypothetical protein QF535_16675 [Anaerolineales bacterium]|jgi:hypothetical protein|nr:hypothetical protein [Anaerolineales bacterium]|tara:strand:+ start:206 stop:715 length:510 start_codon:yes stop_codon:yes gene_type:complete